MTLEKAALVGLLALVHGALMSQQMNKKSGGMKTLMRLIPEVAHTDTLHIKYLLNGLIGA